MQVGLQAALSDANLDAMQPSSQRQVAVSISAIADTPGLTAPLNLCLILDHSGSMSGRALETVKQATHRIVDSLAPGDRLSIVVFDHKAKVLVPNQVIDTLLVLELMRIAYFPRNQVEQLANNPAKVRSYPVNHIQLEGHYYMWTKTLLYHMI